MEMKVFLAFQRVLAVEDPDDFFRQPENVAELAKARRTIVEYIDQQSRFFQPQCQKIRVLRMISTDLKSLAKMNMLEQTVEGDNANTGDTVPVQLKQLAFQAEEIARSLEELGRNLRTEASYDSKNRGYASSSHLFPMQKDLDVDIILNHNMPLYPHLPYYYPFGVPPHSIVEQERTGSITQASSHRATAKSPTVSENRGALCGTEQPGKSDMLSSYCTLVARDRHPPGHDSSSPLDHQLRRLQIEDSVEDLPMVVSDPE
ncbi:hypothetical protein F5Y12DRAFT_775713 [Xylaria sp. FL1777]|nr:hypothetical protein F5Y12DRAFT_775713 [Xylaria sp. FL1777]